MNHLVLGLVQIALWVIGFAFWLATKHHAIKTAFALLSVASVLIGVGYFIAWVVR
jgi:hypothetical protein